ncbi:MAG: hypothetical protein ACOC44_20520 [Promethearchaeia archaeon]
MLYTILSYFDNRIGPKVLFTFPDLTSIRSNIYFKKIPILMDLYNNGFFIHEFGIIRTANLIFNIYNPSARGRQDRAMLSLLSINEDYNVDLKSFKEIMECLILNLKQDQNIHKAFRYRETENGMKCFSKMKDILLNFHNSLPANNFLAKKKLVEIPTYGLSRKEKSTIIDSIQNTFFKL